MFKITKVVEILNKSDYDKLKPIAHALYEGRLVAFPTETVYGLGGNAFLENSARDIYFAKGRPMDNPLIVHIDCLDKVPMIAKNIPEIFYKLSERFWPGPLTMILEKNDKIPFSVTANLNTVAIRLPKNELARAFIKECGCPVAAPSANTSGGVSPTKAKYVFEDLKGKCDYIIDGGASEVGLESTVLDLTKTPPVILRPGSVTKEQLQEVIPNVIVHGSILNAENEVINPASPGMKYKHYSPKANVIILKGSLLKINEFVKQNIKENDCVCIYDEQKELMDIENKYLLGSSKHLEIFASKIFDYMRDADNKNYENIYIPAVLEKGIGLAIMNRIKKSAGGNIITL